MSSQEVCQLFSPNSRATTVNLRKHEATLRKCIGASSTLPPNFLKGWKSLRRVDLTLLSELGVNSIGEHFLSGCTSLREVTGLQALAACVVRVDAAGMMEGCSRSVSLDLFDADTKQGILKSPLGLELARWRRLSSVPSSRCVPASVRNLLLLLACFLGGIAVYWASGYQDLSSPPPCSCLRNVSTTRRHPLMARMLVSSRAVGLVHVHTQRPAREVAQWVSELGGCVRVALANESVESIDAFYQYVRDQQQRDAQGARCLVVVVPYELAAVQVMNALKEATEANSLRGQVLIESKWQAHVLLVASTSREQLLQHLEHRTVHVMSSVEF